MNLKLATKKKPQNASNFAASRLAQANNAACG